MKNSIIGLIGIVLICSMLVGCNSKDQKVSASENDSLETIIKKAKEEGEIYSLGMPDSWANWGETWNNIAKKYNIQHKDTDMSSAEELSKFESEGESGTADIGDVGISFGPLAENKNLLLSYKTSYWDEIPDWAKDKEGNWLLSYTGTIAFIIDKENVSKVPTSWKELIESNYKVSVGDVTKGNQSQFSVLAAAYVNGGDESNIEPGLDYFKKLAKSGRLLTIDSNITNLEKGEIEVGILWDFNALNYRDNIDKDRFEVVIPTDGSITSGYSTIINKNAPHPNAAKLAREYILSDEGQINLARGYARPIRSIELPNEVKEKLLPDSSYESTMTVKDNEIWDKTALKLPELWQTEVLANAK